MPGPGPDAQAIIPTSGVPPIRWTAARRDHPMVLCRSGRLGRLTAEQSLGVRVAGLLTAIETAEALEGYLLPAQSQDDA